MMNQLSSLDELDLEVVLVVEDDEAVRDVLCRGMERHGYHVLTACDGEDALRVAERYRSPIGLVISDLVMPQMNGSQLFDRLRSWYPNIRFLFISGYTRPLLIESLLDCRTAFLPKPFTLDDLVSEGRALLDYPVPRWADSTAAMAVG